MRPKIFRNCTFVISAKVPGEENARGLADAGLAVNASPIVTINFTPTPATTRAVNDSAAVFAPCIVKVAFLKQGPPRIVLFRPQKRAFPLYPSKHLQSVEEKAPLDEVLLCRGQLRHGPLFVSLLKDPVKQGRQFCPAGSRPLPQATLTPRTSTLEGSPSDAS